MRGDHDSEYSIPWRIAPVEIPWRRNRRYAPIDGSGREIGQRVVFGIVLIKGYDRLARLSGIWGKAGHGNCEQPDSACFTGKHLLRICKN